MAELQSGWRVKSKSKGKTQRAKVTTQSLLKIILRLVPAGLAAIVAVVLAVLGEANLIIRLAQRAILDAVAGLFRAVTNQTLQFFVGHGKRLTFRAQRLPTHSRAKSMQKQTGTQIGGGSI
jgi:hypothetical protein